MNTRLLAGALLASCFAVSAHAGFLQFPLRCSTPGATCPSWAINYTIHGAYTANAMNSILDHSMFQNPAPDLFYPYGVHVQSGNGGNKKIIAFNGEPVSGTVRTDDFRCVFGTILIRPDWDPNQRLTNDGGCNSSYTSYDEHPGYDYKADPNTPVYASATGTVISTVCYLAGTAGTGTGGCGDWGALAIRPTGTNYFYQYFHMNTTISVTPGQTITAGTQVGTVGGRCGIGCSIAPHLHFEVRHIGPQIGPEAYPVVDPYGWVGGGADPLYSAPYVPPANLWQ